METLEAENNSYDVAAVLIVQPGKNFATDVAAKISGSELLDLATVRIHGIQDLAVGRLVIVEAEDYPRLIDFYENNASSALVLENCLPPQRPCPRLLYKCSGGLEHERPIILWKCTAANRGTERVIEGKRQRAFSHVKQF